MRQYLERVFPVLSKENNETAANRTWHLYDMINFLEFMVFLMLRSMLNAFFNICFVIAKFGFVLFLTYALAYTIFYYFDRFLPQESKEKLTTSTSKLKRPSEFGAWKENSIKSYPYIASYHSKLDANDDENKLTLPMTKSDIRTSGLDTHSNISGESVVRVGSFKRPSAESGQQSIVGRALEDLVNIQTKTYSSENKLETVSLTKGGAEDEEVEENRTSNA